LKTRRVGVIYNKDKTGAYLQRAQRVAAKFGINLVVKEVTSPREVFAQLDSLKGNVDALWMLPDSMVISQITVEGFVNFSIGQNVPVVSFASMYLKYGVSAVLEIDQADMGAQAGAMIADLLEGQTPAIGTVPRKSLLQFNLNIMKRLGMPSDLTARILQNWEYAR
jgi:putative ABC transport system substrate-binding protein